MERLALRLPHPAPDDTSCRRLDSAYHPSCGHRISAHALAKYTRLREGAIINVLRKNFPEFSAAGDIFQSDKSSPFGRPVILLKGSHHVLLTKHMTLTEKQERVLIDVGNGLETLDNNNA